MDLSEKKKLFIETEDTLEEKSKGYDSTMKKIVKEHLLKMIDILKNKSIS